MSSKCQLFIPRQKRSFRGFLTFLLIFEYKIRARERAIASDRAPKRESKNNTESVCSRG
jgi:hypothetical protein